MNLEGKSEERGNGGVKYTNIQICKNTNLQIYTHTQIYKYTMQCFGFGRSEDRGNGGVSAIGVLPQIYRCTKVQKYKNKIQKYKNTKIQKYKNTKIQKYNAGVRTEVMGV